MHEPDEATDLRLLGGWLARWRTELGVSQRKLADMAGIDQGGLSRVERGLQACGGHRLARLLMALDWLASASMTGSTPPPIRSTHQERPPDS